MQASEQKAIQVTDLTVAYQDKPVLWDIDLDVPPGVLLAIVGPNGAGKTTLVKAILGLVRPAAGNVLIYDKPYEAQRRIVGYVPPTRERGLGFSDERLGCRDDGMLRRAWLDTATGQKRTRTGDAGVGEGRYGGVYHPSD